MSLAKYLLLFTACVMAGCTGQRNGSSNAVPGSGTSAAAVSSPIATVLIDFRGDTLGMTREEFFRRKPGRSEMSMHCEGEPRFQTCGELEERDGDKEFIIFIFAENRLEKIVYDFSPSKFDAVNAALKQKFGDPTHTGTTVAAGMETDWSLPNQWDSTALIFASQFVDGGETSRVTFLDIGLSRKRDGFENAKKAKGTSI